MNVGLSVPAGLVLLAGCAEALWWRLRRGSYAAHWRWLVWAVRPWAVWAVFNLIYRWQAARGFNNPNTFPFFANPWQAEASVGQVLAQLAGTGAFWLGTLLVLGLWGGAVALAWWTARVARWDWRHGLAIGGGCFGLAVALPLSLAALPAGRTSLLAAWQTRGSTMLHAMPVIESASGYAGAFLERHAYLARATIHAASHPPGASLALYWIGRVMGLGDRPDVRASGVQLRYCLGLTVFSALSACILFGLGTQLFQSQRVGAWCALLWACSPATNAYNTFAQDGLYAVFFNLALLLIWMLGSAEKRAWLWAALLGGVLFCLTQLNYSWCLMTTILVLFLALMGRRRQWAGRDYFIRMVAPLAIMTVLAGAYLAYSRFNYWAAYQQASAFVKEWYHFKDAYQWWVALLGGQLDLWLMMGAVPCVAFLAALASALRRRPLEPALMFLLVILGVFALPILFGPNCLKMETSRCWNWVVSVPLAFAAARLWACPAPRAMSAGALGTSLLAYYLMRLFINFGC